MTRPKIASTNIPMGRAGQPPEIATCFVFLARQDISFFLGPPYIPTEEMYSTDGTLSISQIGVVFKENYLLKSGPTTECDYCALLNYDNSQ